MPNIIPRQATAAPTNVTPGIGAAIGQGLQAVAGAVGQYEKGKLQEKELEIKAAERRERNAAIEAFHEKSAWRHKYMQEVRATRPPEEYLDAMEEGENEYDNVNLAGKSEAFIDNYSTFDRISRFNALSRMATSMQRDMLANEKHDWDTQMDVAIANAIAAGGDLSGINTTTESFRANGLIPEAQLQTALEDAIEEVNQGVVRNMPIEQRIQYLQDLESSGETLEGVNIQEERAQAVREYNTKQSIAGIKNNSTKMGIAHNLYAIFDDGTKDKVDAIAALNEMGLEKDSAPYIYGMSLIDSAYQTKESLSDTVELTPEQKAENEILMNLVDNDIDIANERISKDNLESMIAEDKEGAMRLLEETSTMLRNRADQIMKSPKPDLKKLGELQSIQEQILSRVSGQYGSSLSSRVYESFKSINVAGRGRVFSGENAAREEMIYRQAMLDGLNSIPYNERHSPVPDQGQLNSAVWKLEQNAMAAVELSRGSTGDTDDLVKKFEEREKQSRQVSERTVDQNRAAVYSTISSGRKPAPTNMDDARQLATAILPQGSTQDVIEVEAQRLMDMGAPSKSVSVTPEQASRAWMNPEYQQFIKDREAAMKYQPSMFKILEDALTPIIDNPEYKPNYGNLGLTEEERAAGQERIDREINAGLRRIYEFIFGSPFSGDGDVPESVAIDTLEERFGQ